MTYQLVPASAEDRPWLEQLRREVYQDLYVATFGGWDEVRHARHCSECWERGGILIVTMASERVGMIQLLDEPDAVDVGEIQIQPGRQNQGIGSRLLMDTIASAQSEGKRVSLSVALKNVRAFRLYERLGFQKVGESDTHHHMSTPQK